MSHPTTDHKTIDKIIKTQVCYEDTDTYLVIGIDEDDRISASQYWGGDWVQGDTLLEVLYKLYPKCYCDEMGG